MVKPQFDTSNEEYFSSNLYPEAIDKLLSEFEDNEILKENARLMIEIAYKTGYVDAWKEALFFHK